MLTDQHDCLSKEITKAEKLRLHDYAKENKAITKAGSERKRKEASDKKRPQHQIFEGKRCQRQ